MPGLACLNSSDEPHHDDPQRAQEITKLRIKFDQSLIEYVRVIATFIAYGLWGLSINSLVRGQCLP